MASMHEHLSVLISLNNWNNMTTDYNIGFLESDIFIEVKG